MLEGNRKDTNIPSIIIPNAKANELLGITGLPLEYHPVSRGYFFIDGQGIIRLGITLDFFLTHPEYFDLPKNTDYEKES